MLLGRVERLVAADGGFQGFGQRVVAAFLRDHGDLSGAGGGIVDLRGACGCARQQPVGQRADLLRLLAGPSFKGPDGDLGLGEDMGDVLDDVTPAARLGGEPVQHLRIGQRPARLGPERQRGGPMRVIGPDCQPDAQPLPAKGRRETGQPVGGLRVKLALAKILRQRAEDVFLADHEAVIAVERGARHLHPDAAQRALAQRAVGGRQTPWVTDQPGKQPRARAAGPPEGGAVFQESLSVGIHKDLQRGRPRAMRAQMQTDIHVIEPLTPKRRCRAIWV